MYKGTNTRSLCSYIMASHVAGLAVMKCEADATGKPPSRTVLSILVHHLHFLTVQMHLFTNLAHLLFYRGIIYANFHLTPLNYCEKRQISMYRCQVLPTFVLIVFNRCFTLDHTDKLCVPAAYCIYQLIN